MGENIDYIALMDIAKINLTNKINEERKKYKNTPNEESKKELIRLTNDRQKLFLFDTDTIKKYL